ncbi:gamma-glutamylcyclotransferase family protein [Ottowia pentelensis]|uniref:gamma-glutamylcyclotransferase family protein n=1 Tax=Ottowia pentelensis TaxID=511108 RepID=UPI003645F3C5
MAGRHRARHPAARRLGAAAGYPGIVLDEAGEPVQGFVFTSPELHLHWPRLDAFEGDGYERVAVLAELPDGQRVEAQIYALRRN